MLFVFSLFPLVITANAMELGFMEITNTSSDLSMSDMEKLTNEYDIGLLDFYDAVKSKGFVDKTEFILEFFKHRHVLTTSPRRYGRTLLIDMLKSFSEIPVDANGTRLPIQSTNYYTVFSTNNLSIFRDEHAAFIREHFMQYPIILLDFNKLDCRHWSNFREDVSEFIGNIFEYHKYLLHSPYLNPQQKKQIYKYSKHAEHLGLSNKMNSLKFLSQMLYTHFKKKCIVLVDDLDSPLQDSIFNPRSNIRQTVLFVKNMMGNLLNANPYVDRAYLGACARLSKVMADNLHGVKHFYFTDKHEFNRFFGMTEKEVIGLTKKLNFEKNFDKIKEFYNGYGVVGSDIRIYSLYSVINYFEQTVWDTYFYFYYSRFTEELLLKNGLYEKFFALFKKQTIEIYDIEPTEEKMYTLKKLIHRDSITEIEPEYVDLYLGLLVDLSYFTIVEKRRTERGEIFKIVVPNEEISWEIERHMYMQNFIKEKFNVGDGLIFYYMKAIRNLGPTNTSYAQLGKSARNLFRNKGFPKSHPQLVYTLFAFPWYEHEEFDRVRTDVVVGEGHTIDLMIGRKDKTGIIMKMVTEGHVGEESMRVLREMVGKRYYDVFNRKYKYLNVSTLVLVGFYLNAQGKCSVSYLYNSTDIGSAQTVIIP